MIRDAQKWEEWETEFVRHTPVDFARNLAVMDDLYEHAAQMCPEYKRAPLDGLESRVELARILNGRRADRETGDNT